MLPLTQTASGLKAFWDTLSSEQKALLDKVVQVGLGPLIASTVDLPEEVGAILASDGTALEKATAASNYLPQISAKLQQKKLKGESSDVTRVQCPVCQSNFYANN